MGDRDQGEGFNFDALPAEIRERVSLFEDRKCAIRKS